MPRGTTATPETFASHPKAVFWSSKNEKLPSQVPLKHQYKYWFNCDECKHEFEQYPYHIVRSDVWCSYCGNKKLCDNESCEYCLSKSFASVEKAKYWSSKNTGKPRDYFKNCNTKKFKFDCDCGSEFEASLNNITFGKWCRSCGFESMKEKQSLSFEDFKERSIEKFGETYDYSKVVMDGADRPVIIICKKHSCEFQTTPYRHYSYKTGCCPTCAIETRAETHTFTSDKFIELATGVHGDKYDYSLVEYKKNVMPVKIICKDCGIFEQSPSSHLSGCGCPSCVNKTEKKLFKFLKKKFPSTKKEYKPAWVIDEDGRKLRFDFHIPELNLIIELDGRQHFKQILSWLTPEEQLKRDVFKMKKANENGLFVIRLLQEEVFKNDSEWLEVNLTSELVIRKDNLFIAEKIDLYENHIALLD